jgi:hypothetical protein
MNFEVVSTRKQAQVGARRTVKTPSVVIRPGTYIPYHSMHLLCDTRMLGRHEETNSSEAVVKAVKIIK